MKEFFKCFLELIAIILVVVVVIWLVVLILAFFGMGVNSAFDVIFSIKNPIVAFFISLLIVLVIVLMKNKMF